MLDLLKNLHERLAILEGENKDGRVIHLQSEFEELFTEELYRQGHKERPDTKGKGGKETNE